MKYLRQILSLLTIIFSKMRYNGVLTIFLIGSAVLFSALICSIPLFSAGSLQNLFVKSMELYQRDTGTYPGKMASKFTFFDFEDDQDRSDFYEKATRKIEESVLPSLDIQLLKTTKIVSIRSFPITRDYGNKDENDKLNKKKPYIDIMAMENLEDHIIVKTGRLPKPGIVDGRIEVVVTEEFIVKRSLLMETEYEYFNTYDDASPPFQKLIIVGIFEPTWQYPEFWNENLSEYSKSAFINYDFFKSTFIDTDSLHFAEVIWHTPVDYTKIKAAYLSGFLSRLLRASRKLSQENIQMEFAAQDLLITYIDKARYLQTILWLLYVPILILLGFLIYMISQFIVDNERNPIAVMKSRGGSRSQLFYMYLTESLLMAGVAFILGPFIGYILCTVLGASNGFLEFVQRKSLPLTINGVTWFYSLVGSIFFVITMMIPITKATTLSIVLFKQKKSKRGKSKPFWKQFYLDLILLGISLYGLFTYSRRTEVLLMTGAAGTDIPMDPMLFVVSTLFILSMGLFSLRITPFLIDLIFKLNKKRWSAVVYGSLIQVVRAGGKEQFLMLFLIFCLALGIFDSTSARTINRNVVEKIYYKNGSGIVIQPIWPKSSYGNNSTPDFLKTQNAGVVDISIKKARKDIDFESFKNIKGLTHLARVATIQAKASYPTGGSKVVDFVCISPGNFGKVAWMRSDLFPIHWFNYLNVLAQNTNGILVSKNIWERQGLKIGNSITLTLSDGNKIDLIVCGTFDFWPNYFPKTAKYSEESLSKEGKARAKVVGLNDRYLIVGNMDHIFSYLTIYPYDIWAKRDPKVKTSELYQDIKEKKLKIFNIFDSRQQLIKEKNDPMLQGINGVFSLGFVICIIICFIGFIIYWLFSLKARTLQLGIFRAMGLRQIDISLMLLIEQFILVGTSLAAGIGVGVLASKLFVPLLQMAGNIAEQVPPFRVFVETSDMIRIIGVSLAMFGLGALFFKRLLDKMQIARSLKLGED